MGVVAFQDVSYQIFFKFIIPTTNFSMLTNNMIVIGILYSRFSYLCITTGNTISLLQNLAAEWYFNARLRNTFELSIVSKEIEKRLKGIDLWLKLRRKY